MTVGRRGSTSSSSSGRSSSTTTTTDDDKSLQQCLDSVKNAKFPASDHDGQHHARTDDALVDTLQLVSSLSWPEDLKPGAARLKETGAAAALSVRVCCTP